MQSYLDDVKESKSFGLQYRKISAMKKNPLAVVTKNVSAF